jgi:hypothetical protein
MKNSSKLAGVAGAALLASLSVPANAAVTISGGVSNIDIGATEPGLTIFGSALSFADIVLNNVGDFAFRKVANIGTTEGSVRDHDFDSYPISLTFDFSQPAGTSGPAIGGDTSGKLFFSWDCFFDDGCGVVDFSSTPTIFNFGNGGQFSVKLYDASFGTPGSADIRAKFELLSNSGVPEPSTWAMMILGFGLIGGVMRRRQRQTVRYSFA